MNLESNNWTKIGEWIFITYIFFCIYLFQERCFYADSAMYLFNIINYEEFNIVHGRYGAVFPQLLPLISILLNLPELVIYIIYSISYPLFYFFIYKVIMKYFKNVAAAFSILVLLLLGVKDSFFNPIYEYQLSIVYCCFFYAVLSAKQKLKPLHYYSLSILSITLSLFTHIQILPILLFIIVYYFLNTKSNYKHVIVMSVVAIAIFSVRMALIKSGSYQSDQIIGIEGLISNFHDLKNNYTLNFLLNKEQFAFLHFFALIFIVTLSLYGNWKNGLLISATYISYIIIIACMIPAEAEVVIEKNFMPLGVIISLPFIDTFIIKNTIKPYLGMAFMLTLTLIFSSLLFTQQEKHSKRLNYQRSIIKSMSNYTDKGYINEQSLNSDVLFYTWANSVESLLISTLYEKKPLSFYVLKHNEILEPNLTTQNDFFFFTFYDKKKPQNEMNKRFNLSEGVYEKIHLPIILGND